MLFQHKNRSIDLVGFIPNLFSKHECEILISKQLTNEVVNKVLAVSDKLNKDFYRFNISEMRELNIIEILSSERSEDWVVDIQANENSINRKLSFMVFLSDKNSYTGGQIHFEPEENKVDQNQGNFIIFPSFFSYRFDKITKGNLKILSGWFCGSPFR